MTKKIVEITSLKELIEIAQMDEYSSSAAISGMAAIPPKEKIRKRNNMRREMQTEQLLRQHIRKKIKAHLKEQSGQEEQLRLVIRSLIQEAKDTANPHPSTGINKLRDAFRKAKPSIKTKFQQLTTSQEQRQSFTAHLLNAFMSLYDQLDALNAQGAAPDIDAPSGGDAAIDGLAPPPEDTDIEADVEAEVAKIISEIEVKIEDDDEEIDVVSDEKPKEKSQVEKDVDKKKDLEAEREAFGSGVGEMDKTGRNQSFDAFRLVQSYFSDAYLDLDNEADREMFKTWMLYNLDLLLKSYESELNPDLAKPDIPNPEGA